MIPASVARVWKIIVGMIEFEKNAIDSIQLSKRCRQQEIQISNEDMSCFYIESDNLEN